MKPRLAIFHYHLRPGGVTTVIRNAARALGDSFAVTVLDGEESLGPGFGYDERPARGRRAFLAQARALKNRLAASLRGVDLLHTHNPTLGKNPRLSCALKLLADDGAIRMLHQVHDFSEDDRPAQLRAWRFCTGRRDDRFWREWCYYDRPNLVWATLTAADASHLAARGVPAAKIHVLPNPVDDEFFRRPSRSPAPLEAVRERLAAFAKVHRYRFEPDRKILLSPMKVMVRKNNAEAVELLRRLNRLSGQRQYQLLISLDAVAPRDRAYRDRLKRRIRRAGLPVVIGFGRELDDPLPLFQLAHAIVTTSRSEGFGYVFVEGWLCGKLVVGREIPSVLRDFRAAGMDLDHLYRRLDDTAVRQTARLLARPPRALIAHNRAVVRREYSLAAYRKRYVTLFRRFP